jgi:type IV pilus assembly protein PilN
MIRVNLLGVKEKRQIKGIHVEFLIFLLILCGISIGYYVVNNNLNNKISSLNNQKNHLKRELRKLQKIKREVDAFKRKKDELQRKINIVKRLKRGQKGYYKILTTLEYALPEDIWVSSFKYNNGRLQLTGASLRTSSVNEFIMNLYKTKMFQGIDLRFVKKKTVENIDINEFSIDAKVLLGG